MFSLVLLADIRFPFRSKYIGAAQDSARSSVSVAAHRPGDIVRRWAWTKAPAAGIYV
jgi:hypothetical protein